MLHQRRHFTTAVKLFRSVRSLVVSQMVLELHEGCIAWRSVPIMFLTANCSTPHFRGLRFYRRMQFTTKVKLFRSVYLCIHAGHMVCELTGWLTLYSNLGFGVLLDRTNLPIPSYSANHPIHYTTTLAWLLNRSFFRTHGTMLVVNKPLGPCFLTTVF